MLIEIILLISLISLIWLTCGPLGAAVSVDL